MIELEVGNVANGGWCVARHEGRVVFVRHALPGERVRARVTEETAWFLRADAIEVLRPSPDRVTPPCPYAGPGRCGGCDWQHASLEAQRALKAEVIAEQLRRLAGIRREVTVEEVPGAPDGLGWRTRVRFAARPDGVLGLRRHRSHEIEPVDACLIAHPEVEKIGVETRNWRGAASVEAIASATGDRAVVVALPKARRSGKDAEHAAGTRPTDAEGTRHTEEVRDSRDAGDIRDSRDSVGIPGEGPADGDVEVPDLDASAAILVEEDHRTRAVRGRADVRERAGGRTFHVTANGFWQVHPGAAETLLRAVLRFAEPRPGDWALDLYCGAGLFTAALAEAVGPEGAVLGVESDREAVRNARRNLRDLPHASVERGRIEPALNAAGVERADIVVADPPRTGLGRSVVDRIADLRAARIVYVSCDPATMARDIAWFDARGYHLTDLRAFDAFPMTAHVECVALLQPGRSR
ncbi:class I SAM-dependent RNA methyltransferase [Thermopolyspora sp. NPDC052614]|uniref:class I SAM-dependent RNA methyltransferase n=1 Tax=Thermopolyspora sp. NPDC052614 TaxID=3155682 RepID=UPI003435FE8B